MATEALLETFVEGGVLDLLLHRLAQVFRFLLGDGHRIFEVRIVRIDDHVFSQAKNFGLNILVQHTCHELLVQDEAVQVIRKTATDVRTDNRQECNRIGDRKVSGHGNELRIRLAKRGAAQFNFKRDFRHNGGVIRIHDKERCVIGPQLEVHGRFDIDNREQVDPQLETEALHRAVKTIVHYRYGLVFSYGSRF